MNVKRKLRYYMCYTVYMQALTNAYINVSMTISLKHKLSIKVKQRNVCFDSLHVLMNLFFCNVSMAISLKHELRIKVKLFQT